ncbi:hypothetical protein MKX03_009867 [Papaver bracteatum]|nr:hypothetical protein MKX03_009867 [Papaver bracteatum]
MANSYLFIIDESNHAVKAETTSFNVENDTEVLCVDGWIKNISRSSRRQFRERFKLPRDADTDAIFVASVNGSIIVSVNKVKRPKISNKFINIIRI